MSHITWAWRIKMSHVLADRTQWLIYTAPYRYRELDREQGVLIFCREINVYTGSRPRKEMGSIVSYCTGPVTCTCPCPVHCEETIITEIIESCTSIILNKEPFVHIILNYPFGNPVVYFKDFIQTICPSSLCLSLSLNHTLVSKSSY